VVTGTVIAGTVVGAGTVVTGRVVGAGTVVAGTVVGAGVVVSGTGSPTGVMSMRVDPANERTWASSTVSTNNETY